MSRCLAILAALLALQLLAGVALAAAATGGGNPPPSGGTPPFDPPPPTPPGPAPSATCPVQEIHPIPCRLWTVTCTARVSGAACSVKVSGSATASAEKIALRLPRRFLAVDLTCRATDANRIACRLLSETVRAATGTRTVVLGLPKSFTIVHISCATNSRARFACRLRK